MNLAQQIADWADRLRDLSAFGLRYSEDIYNRDRYRAVQDTAIQMLAYATGEDCEDLEPLRAAVLSRPTPFAVGDASVIDTQGRILLIQRSDNHNWAMPGGALEVGETPAEGVAREALEETGVPCRPVALVGVFDSRRCNTASRHHMYIIQFLCQPLAALDAAPASHAHETLAAAWFGEHDLPEPIEPGHAERIRQAYRVWRGEPGGLFDR